jgi:Cytochrome c oxidase subunit IV
MRTAGRIFMVLAALAVAAGIAYALLAKELAGTVMLGVFAVAVLYIASVLEHAGPYDRAEVDPEAKAEVGPEHRFPPSWWPLVMAVGSGTALLGLAFQPVIGALGVGVFLVAIVGWFVQAGRHEAHAGGHATERAHHDPSP